MDSATDAERRRAANYPLSRWYLRPLAGMLARRLTNTRITPCQVTCCGLLLATAAATVLVASPRYAWLAPLLTLGYWFCDRTDGQLARLRGATKFGAWLDANVDELVDMGLHAAVAYAAAQAGSVWAWPCLFGFIAGKYLLMYGLLVEPPQASTPDPADGAFRSQERMSCWRSRLHTLYHLPGNADVRLHLLVAALFTGQYAGELALVMAYYNLRWMVRYGLVARRLGGAA